MTLLYGRVFRFSSASADFVPLILSVSKDEPIQSAHRYKMLGQCCLHWRRLMVRLAHRERILRCWVDVRKTLAVGAQGPSTWLRMQLAPLRALPLHRARLTPRCGPC